MIELSNLEHRPIYLERNPVKKLIYILFIQHILSSLKKKERKAKEKRGEKKRKEKGETERKKIREKEEKEKKKVNLRRICIAFCDADFYVTQFSKRFITAYFVQGV